ncbi:PKD domain-containing protein [Undibacterium arcticum]|uniref:PKD domain-containing protein n=1 Tax=Undibacterium arcticum TaxID=1762892 RepID=A0ABV7F5H8_9BURK
MRRYLLSVLGLLSFLIGLGAAPSALATTTTLTFDEYPDGTTLTTQYQGVGVTISGAAVSNALATPWPANTGANVAFAQTGLMTFTLNSTITGAIQTVSAYVSGDTSVGIYAYDVGGVLIGQSVTPGATNNLLVSVASSGNPIARVAIHDGGSSFAIDTLTFATTVVSNVKPVADAGDKQKARIGSLVTLDGSRSVDPDHQPQPLAYHWTQTFGPSVALSGATTVRPTFTPLTQGNYVFSLVVNDGQANSNTATVKVTASKNGNLSAAEVSGILVNPFGK